jgi:16S rRNA (cytidine1402-2'-O)-methyltransferase
LEQIKEFFGEETKVSLSREISKKFEETKRGTINELIEFSKSKTLKGEIVLIVNNSI